MAKAPKKGPYIPGVTPTGATGLPMPTDGLLSPGGGGNAPYLPKPIYEPGISPTGATGQPLPFSTGAFTPQPALPGGWGGAPAPWPPQSDFNPAQWNQSPLMSQYAAQMDPLANLYGTQQTNALMNQLNVPTPTYGGINWGSPITSGSGGGGGNGPQLPYRPGDAPPGTLPTTGTGGGIVSPVDGIWGGRPPGAFPNRPPDAGGAGTGDGSFWSGVGDWLSDNAGGIGMLIGTIFGGPLGGMAGQMLGGQFGGDNGMGQMPATPGGTPVNPQPVGTDEIGYMPSTPGGVAVNPQPVAPINPLTEQPTSAFAQWMLTAPTGSTINDFYARQGGFGAGGLVGGAYGGGGQWEADAAHYEDRMSPDYYGRND